MKKQATLNLKWIHRLILSVAMLVSTVSATALETVPAISDVGHQMTMQGALSPDCDPADMNCNGDSRQDMDDCCTPESCDSGCMNSSVMMAIIDQVSFSNYAGNSEVTSNDRLLQDYLSSIPNPPPTL